MSTNEFMNDTNFHHFFQPIYDINNWRITGYEGFLRSTEYPNPRLAFCDAEKEGRLYELDSQSILNAIQTYQQAGFTRKDGFLFLNIFPSTILDDDFLSLAEKLLTDESLTNQQFVLELNGEVEIADFNECKQRIKALKELGFLLAIDNVGTGYSKYQTIIELDPEYIKLERYFSEDLYTSSKKKSILQLINEYCKATGSKLILEGLETEITLALAKSLGIQYGQGYLLGDPKIIR